MSFSCDLSDVIVCVGRPVIRRSCGVSDGRLAAVHRLKQTLAHLHELEGAAKNRRDLSESLMKYSTGLIILCQKG